MNLYLIVLGGAGALILLVAWLPMVLKAMPLSLPMFCVAFGYAVFGLTEWAVPMPLVHSVTWERLTETVLIIALMGAGLKLDREIGWRAWRTTWRLLGIAMPVCIGLVALSGYAVLDLSFGAALLLGAALAPTDPVLASDVQVGPPKSGEEDEVRFSLTSEAGLNDGLAFPFVNLALLMLAATSDEWVQGGLEGWLLRDVAWRCFCAVVMGWMVGRGLGWLTFHLPQRAALSRTGEGFVALGMTFLSFSLTELAGGYGFLAVFVTALALRSAERHHDFHTRLHEFTDQIERLLTMVLLVLFGGALAGGLLDALTWPGAIAGLALLFLFRPLSALGSLIGLRMPPWERGTIAFFGVRGMGSFYYLAHAFNQHRIPEAEQIWAIVGFTILISILVHGATVSTAMGRLDRRLRLRSERQARLAVQRR